MVNTSKDVCVTPVEEPPAKRVKTETMTTVSRTCQFCTNKKQVSASCISLACKKCCLMRSQVCIIHPKEKLEPEPARPQKKRVLKNEFRETNFHYYGETVTIFCVRDFFEMKKLCQGVLKDQERTQRVSGNTCGRRKKKNIANSKIKEQIQCALGKRPAPAGYGDVELPAKIAVADT
ncbi:unnamed protein product [Peronospora belbahrii]|uniref:Zn(2)-C6 fungal-type domain-containing protein n=1 Tax=Peronospora belbahrii TaxID=622444 RepID=A0AAU9LDM3_9STRA|nr:unnamed protein product [Peronospora belbahrii]CAH0519624.1 unnamed protein product [Peronospora belbahrii]